MIKFISASIHTFPSTVSGLFSSCWLQSFKYGRVFHRHGCTWRVWKRNIIDNFRSRLPILYGAPYRRLDFEPGAKQLAGSVPHPEPRRTPQQNVGKVKLKQPIVPTKNFSSELYLPTFHPAAPRSLNFLFNLVGWNRISVSLAGVWCVYSKKAKFRRARLLIRIENKKELRYKFSLNAILSREVAILERKQKKSQDARYRRGEE